MKKTQVYHVSPIHSSTLDTPMIQQIRDYPKIGETQALVFNPPVQSPTGAKEPEKDKEEIKA